MAKRIKFPLLLKDDFQVRTLEELREHFDLEKVLVYYQNGKLLTWLEDRYYEREVELLQDLTPQSPNLPQQLCQIFGISFTGKHVVDLEILAEKQKKIEQLKQYTDDEKILQLIDQVAFTQEDLADILDDGYSIIYLCNNSFRVPSSKKNIAYIGIGNVLIPNFENIKKICHTNNITFTNIEQCKNNYIHIIESMNTIFAQFDEIHINVSNPPSFIVSDKEYYTVNDWGSSERKALEKAQNCVSLAYAQWINMFREDSLSNINKQHAVPYLNNEYEKMLSLLHTETEKIIQELLKLIQTINDSELQYECTKIIKKCTLKNICWAHMLN